MENEIVKPEFDYGVVPESSRELVKIKTVETKILVRQTAQGIIEIGKNLITIVNTQLNKWAEPRRKYE